MTTTFTNSFEDSELTTILVVSDLEKSKSFYLDILGAEFITPPYDWGYEVRCFFRDPDGHLFEISELKSR